MCAGVPKNRGFQLASFAMMFSGRNCVAADAKSFGSVSVAWLKRMRTSELLYEKAGAEKYLVHGNGLVASVESGRQVISLPAEKVTASVSLSHRQTKLVHVIGEMPTILVVFEA
jgi:hypothetical protein